MVLNRVWIGMFITALIMGFSKLIFWQDTFILQQMLDSFFEAAKSAFELALYMTGILTLWMGLMKIGEDSGAVNSMSRVVYPLFSKLFPEIPKNHPAMGSIMLNFSANMLGLDNAATPAGLRAMQHLQELNPKKDTASNAQIMFLVLNASGLTIIPVSILAARSAGNSTNPTSVFIPILLTTYFATLGGLIFVAIRQRINLFQKTIILYIGTLTLLIVGLLWYLKTHPDEIDTISRILSSTIIFAFISFFIYKAIRSKIQAYESFIEGAKGGFQVAINILPYLVAMLCAVALFRSCGALTDLMNGIKFLLLQMGIMTTEFIHDSDTFISQIKSYKLQKQIYEAGLSAKILGVCDIVVGKYGKPVIVNGKPYLDMISIYDIIDYDNDNITTTFNNLLYKITLDLREIKFNIQFVRIM